jgi:hypothetical protein
MLGCCLTAVTQAGAAVTQDDSDSPHATVEGCLSETGGHYELTGLGKHYQLTGDTAKLKPLVGKEVRVYGALLAADPWQPGSVAASAQQADEEQIRVSTADQMDDVCWHSSGARR